MDRIDIVLTFITTVLAAACGAISVSFFGTFAFHDKSDPTNKFKIDKLIKGLLAGCVSVASSCSNIGKGSACVVGLIGGLIILSLKKLWLLIGIDDPLDASILHGCCGFFGVIA